MNKIPTLFVRDNSRRLVVDEITPGCEWVVDGLGIATIKHDGTCVLIRGGRMFKRHEVRAGSDAPPAFEPADEPDPRTGKTQGWVPVSESDPCDRWHREAVQNDGETPWHDGAPDGTYELCGPKIQGNPEGLLVHMVIPHGLISLPWFPRTFDAIRATFEGPGWKWEGVVWHLDNGDMVKIKNKDFGLTKRPIKASDGECRL